MLVLIREFCVWLVDLASPPFFSSNLFFFPFEFGLFPQVFPPKSTIRKSLFLAESRPPELPVQPGHSSPWTFRPYPEPPDPGPSVLPGTSGFDRKFALLPQLHPKFHQTLFRCSSYTIYISAYLHHFRITHHFWTVSLSDTIATLRFENLSCGTVSFCVSAI